MEGGDARSDASASPKTLTFLAMVNLMIRRQVVGLEPYGQSSFGNFEHALIALCV